MNDKYFELAGAGVIVILGAIAAIVIAPFMALGWIGYRLGIMR